MRYSRRPYATAAGSRAAAIFPTRCNPTSPAVRSAAASLLAVLMLGATNAQACRAIIMDPLSYMSHRPNAFTRVFVGEIVGVRNAERLHDLQECQPRSLVLAPADENAQPKGECVDSRHSQVYEVEVYPSAILKGAPAFPDISKASGCLTRPPMVGAEALVFVDEDGNSTVLVRERDDPQFGHSFDDTYLDKVGACAAGHCPRDRADDKH
jgi:hypothetical protein